jgi:thiamine biosynthesis lipoprotein
MTTIADAIGAAEAMLRAELIAIDQACSRFRDDAEIALVHRALGGPVVVSPLLAEAISVALDVAKSTDGAVDPTVGESLIGLGYDRDFKRVPPTGTSVARVAHPARGYRCIEFDEVDRVVRVPLGIILDLGATAKAFAADRAAARIAVATGAGVLVNLGGDISTAGRSPEWGWPIGLARACSFEPRDADVVVAIHSGGLASSGTSVRTWHRNGQRLHHIIDPRTGTSAVTDWQLISVAASSCVHANAASTAGIVWGDDAVARLAAMDLPCRLVHENGTVVTLGGWPAEPRGSSRPQIHAGS